jgi:hypothetical protein
MRPCNWSRTTTGWTNCSHALPASDGQPAAATGRKPLAQPGPALRGCRRGPGCPHGAGGPLRSQYRSGLGAPAGQGELEHQVSRLEQANTDAWVMATSTHVSCLCRSGGVPVPVPVPVRSAAPRAALSAMADATAAGEAGAGAVLLLVAQAPPGRRRRARPRRAMRQKAVRNGDASPSAPGTPTGRSAPSRPATSCPPPATGPASTRGTSSPRTTA